MEKKIERIPFTGKDGVTHMYTEEQFNRNVFVEYVCKEDLENIKLMLARATGQPEPVLYEDSMVGPTATDFEDRFNKFLGIKERMDEGMALIKEADLVIAKIYSKKHGPKLYTAWMQDKGLKVKYPLHEDVVKRFLTDVRNQKDIQWFNYRAKCWDQWHLLNKELNEMGKAHTDLWPAYYELIGSDHTKYNTWGINEMEPEGRDSRILPTDIAYRQAHLEENAELQRLYRQIDDMQYKSK